MKRIILLLGIFLIDALLFACASKVAPVAPLKEKPLGVVAPVAKADWEAKWEKTLFAAKKERKVVVYGGSTAAGLKLHATKPLKEKFGIDLEALSGRGGEIAAKIATERRAGLFMVDVYASGMSTMWEAFKPVGALDPLKSVLILPEVIDPKVWLGNKFPWADKDLFTISWNGIVSPPMALNTNVVQPEEIKSYQELLKPKWKGKIVMNDPTTSGSGFSGFWTALRYNHVDRDFWRQLVKQQDVAITRDEGLQNTWLVRGRFPIALFPSSGRLSEYIKAGAPIALHIPVEGTRVGGSGSGLAFMNKAPHPHAATIFINWFLSREGQALIQKAVDKQSLRTDIGSEGLDPKKIRQPGVQYVPDPGDVEELQFEERPQYEALAREIFGSPTVR